MTIQTERLVLRPLSIDDLEITFEYASDPALAYMIHLPKETKQEVGDFLRWVSAEWAKDKPGFYEFAITLNEQQIGAVSIHLDEQKQSGDMGWILLKAYRGKGYASEAASAVLNFARDELKLNKVTAQCDYRNEASFKIMRKIGFSLESDDGVRRYKDSDEDVQELVYAIHFA